VFGEDLNKFDKIIFGMVNISGMYGRYSLEFFQELATVEPEKLILFYEDWQLSIQTQGWKKWYDMNDKELQDDILKPGGKRFYSMPTEQFNFDWIRTMTTNVIEGKYNIMIPSFKWGDKDIYREFVNYKELYPLDLSPYFIDDFNLINEPFSKEKYLNKLDKHVLNKLGNVTKKEIAAFGITEDELDAFCGTAKSKGVKFDTEYDVFENTKRYKSIVVPKYNHHGSGHFRSRWIFAAYGNAYVLSEPDNRDFEMLGIPNVNILKEDVDTQIDYVKMLKEKMNEYLTPMDELQKSLNKFLNK
jgi:hypothetical protein